MVVPGGPGADGGLLVDDIVLAINKKNVKTYDELVEDLRARNARRPKSRFSLRP